MMARQVAPLAQRASEQLAPLAAAASSTLTAARTTTRAGVHAALQAGASLLVPGLMEELEGQLKGLEQAELDVPPQEERERGRPGAKVRETNLCSTHLSCTCSWCRAAVRGAYECLLCAPGSHCALHMPAHLLPSSCVIQLSRDSPPCLNLLTLLPDCNSPTLLHVCPLQAPANPLAMSVVMVGAECAPWSKTGAHRRRQACRTSYLQQHAVAEP